MPRKGPQLSYVMVPIPHQPSSTGEKDSRPQATTPRTRGGGKQKISLKGLLGRTSDGSVSGRISGPPDKHRKTGGIPSPVSTDVETMGKDLET